MAGPTPYNHATIAGDASQREKCSAQQAEHETERPNQWYHAPGVRFVGFGGFFACLRGGAGAGATTGAGRGAGATRAWCIAPPPFCGLNKKDGIWLIDLPICIIDFPANDLPRASTFSSFVRGANSAH